MYKIIVNGGIRIETELSHRAKIIWPFLLLNECTGCGPHFSGPATQRSFRKRLSLTGTESTGYMGAGAAGAHVSFLLMPHQGHEDQGPFLSSAVYTSPW